MILSRIVFFAQLLVMLSVFTVLLVTRINFYTLEVVICAVGVGLIATLFAVWQFIRHPARRKWALATVATPLLCLTTPFVIVGLAGGPAEPAALVGALLALAAVVCFVLLARRQLWLAGGLFASKRFNIGFLSALVALLALYWLPVFGWLSLHDALSLPNNITEHDNVVRIGLYYFITVAGPALLLSLFTLLYAPIGLVRGSGVRLVHFGQLLLALVTLASLGAGAFVAFVAIINPG